MKILFILKKRKLYTETLKDNVLLTAGLQNSARFVSDMLNNIGYQSKVVEVIDNNYIDREVHQYRPDVAIIEALWVVPSKFEILQKLHPRVKWVVRIHSNLSFLANEGIAIEWLKSYVKYPNVYIGVNSEKALYDVKFITKASEKVLYLPNYYPLDQVSVKEPKLKKPKEFVDVGLFGAIRPLKNQLIQAVAAMKWAESKNKILRLHINSSRKEQGGESNYKNIKNLFVNTKHELYEYDWLPHSEFLNILSNCDVSLCVSFTETFCIVAADSIAANVPVVGSKEIPWITSFLMADPTSVDDVVNKMNLATGLFRGIFKFFNRNNLAFYNSHSIFYWKDSLFRLKIS
ncbi:MAG: glycosyltransferase family 1 protein [Patescibacteria group bacterium]|nr:glycosyltransferase family 1 protein [Patescibacteria group bacterium]